MSAKLGLYLVVEVDEAVWAIDIVEFGKAGNKAIELHRVETHETPASKHPTWCVSTDKDAVGSPDRSEVMDSPVS